MRVTKRNGSIEEVSFDKVLLRLKTLSHDLSIDYFEVAKKVCNRIYDLVKTDELDELASNICSSMIVDDPEFDQLAARISISNHHKKTCSTFSATIKKLFDRENPLISKEVHDVVMANKDLFNSTIDYGKDYLLDYFGFKTVEKSYLLKIDGDPVERPQDMFMRVSIGIHGTDIKKAFETYECMSSKLFTHATPTLFNFGTKREQGSSCFLLAMESDSVSGEYNTLHDCAMISKFAGGIGLHIHNVRANGSLIRGTNGRSSGIVPMLRVYNDAARHINQAGKRNGSFSIYIEPWHADIEAFLDLKKNHGVESERARDLFYALWIPNIFMERVQQNGVWSLMCPDQSPGLSDLFDDGEDKKFTELYTQYEREGKYVRQVQAQDIWVKILESQIETGTPYMLYKDHVNSKTNQKNLGTIKSSNLCVAPETRILTPKGFVPISELEDKNVKVFNGEEFSEVAVFKTGKDRSILTVETVNGHRLRCTRDHEFIVLADSGEEIVVRAEDLVKGMKLPAHRLPLIEDGSAVQDMKYPYTHGFLCGNISANSETSTVRCKLPVSERARCVLHQNRPAELLLKDGQCPCLEFDAQKTLILREDKIQFGSKLTFDCAQEYGEKNTQMRLALPRDIDDKFVVPTNGSLKTRVEWFTGLLDSCGVVNGEGFIHLEGLPNKFLSEVSLMLQTLACKATISESGDTVILDQRAIHDLKISGVKISLRTVAPDTSSSLRSDFIKNVTDLQQKSDTYCFTEPLRNRGLFEGILTSQCSEIVQYTSPEEVAVCNLASVCLPNFVNEQTKMFDYEKLQKVVGIMTTNLNKIIDRNFYPIEKARVSNLKHRPIGIGVQGLADVFFKLGLSYESDAARKINKSIFENIYFAALKQSCALSKEFGPYESFDGSPTSKGILQFDMWDGHTEVTCDWESLRNEISKYGLRNSLVCAPMPTASTSQIMGNTESFEPIQSNIFKRKTLAGEFIIVNKHLIKELQKLNMWNTETKDRLIANDGSVQNLALPTDIKSRFKTVWEISQRFIMDLAADRGRFIDQSQSMNLYQSDPKFPIITRMHFYGWKQGLKTGMYYLRTKAKAAIQKFSLDVSMSKNNYDEPCENCSA